jgi:HlyD family secretion protein
MSVIEAPKQTSRSASIRRHLVAGIAAVGLLFGGVGGWAATTKLAAAVIAPGVLVVDTNVKRIQHPTGGVVGEILVEEGDRVKAGEVLVRLDETQTRANLAILATRLDEFSARAARLEAERISAEAVTFPERLLALKDDPGIARQIEGELSLFKLRREARAGNKSQLRERITQTKEEVEGISGQIIAKEREIELISKELKGIADLYSRGLVPITRMMELERAAARLEGERGQLVAARARAKGLIAEIELQIIQIDQDLRSEVATELADIEVKSAELSERKIAAEDQLNRIELRAPQDGTIHQLEVHTVGGVIGPGDTLMLLVPATDTLTVEAHIAPHEIDRIRMGQEALLRFSAFNVRTTPEILGVISRISADVSPDPNTGASFYTVRVAVPKEETARLGNVRLVPGMPVDVFIETEERTVLSYLVKPLNDQFNRAFREE